MGSVCQNSPFLQHGHVAYQIKENHECSNMEANISFADTPTMGMGPIGKHSPFSEHGHIEYQFKGNQKMQQQHGSKYFAWRRLPYVDGVSRSKSNFFRTWSCCISKFKRIMNAATW